MQAARSSADAETASRLSNIAKGKFGHLDWFTMFLDDSTTADLSMTSLSHAFEQHNVTDEEASSTQGRGPGGPGPGA